MAVDLILVREGFKLGAADSIAAESIEKLKQGECVLATIRRPRNLAHHQKFMALVGLVFKNQEKHPTQKALLNAIKLGTGHFDAGVVMVGDIPVTIAIPRSISFASMKQPEFEDFYAKAVEHIVTKEIVGLDKQDLEREVLKILEGRKNQ